MSDYEIQILNSESKIVKLPSEFVEIDLVLIYNNISRWTIKLPYSEDLWTVGQNFSNQVRIVRDGTLLICGNIRKFDRNKEESSTVSLSGSSPEEYLKNRRAVPVPSGPPYTSQAFDVQSGAAETVVKYYVNYNAGPAAIAARQISGLTIEADSARGSSVKGRARFHKLLELIRGLAEAGGIGFKFDGLEFQCYTPTDRTRTAVFNEERGNLTKFKYKIGVPAANYYYAGGAGTGTSRTFHEAGDSQSIVDNGRIETFLDCRNATDVAEMQLKIEEEIAKNSELAEFSATLVNKPGQLETFSDYNLGDQVSAIADGQALTALVREIRVKIDKNGEVITPLVGNYRSNGGSILKRLQNNESERIENLEVV